MAARKTPASVATAVRSGDTRKALEAMRDKLAHEIDQVGEDDRERLAPMIGRLLDVLRALNEIAEPEVNRKDELRRRREARRATAGGTEVLESPPGGDQRGAGGGRSRKGGGSGSVAVAGAGSRRRPG